MGGVSGAIDSGFTESAMVIDYVRVYQNTTLSVTDKNLENSLFYPNPALDTLYVETAQSLDKIEVFDISGKIVLTEKNPKNAINISSLKAGLYILKAHSKGQFVTRKIVIK